jgi:hypothetical protein
MEAALKPLRVKQMIKLHVQPGPLPIKPPYFEWDAMDPDLIEDEDEIDLTDLFELPQPPKNIESLN